MPKKKSVLITQSDYIPWKGYFDAINMADVFVIYDDVQYTRRDWRNRNIIKTAHGLKWLTIPVEVKGRFSQTVRETKVSNKSWAMQHWKSIQHNYARAKYFEEYKAILENLYSESHEDFLSIINDRFLRVICDLLQIKSEFRVSSEFDLQGDKIERLVGICKTLNATEYISGPAAKDYLDTEAFEESGIKVTWLDYSGYEPYRQLYGDFSHKVSIIDLIFNAGPDAVKYLKSFSMGARDEIKTPT